MKTFKNYLEESLASTKEMELFSLQKRANELTRKIINADEGKEWESLDNQLKVLQRQIDRLNREVASEHRNKHMNENAAANCVGGGAIAGAAGDPPGKAGITQKIVKRKKPNNA